MNETLSANGLVDGAVLFFRIYDKCDVTYNGRIRVGTSWFDGKVKLNSGMFLLYRENDNIAIISF